MKTHLRCVVEHRRGFEHVPDGRRSVRAWLDGDAHVVRLVLKLRVLTHGEGAGDGREEPEQALPMPEAHVLPPVSVGHHAWPLPLILLVQSLQWMDWLAD